MTPGEQIRAARLARGLSTRELADLAGVSNGVANKVERGLPVRLGSLRKVAAALGLGVDSTVELVPQDQAEGEPAQEPAHQLAG